MSAPGAPEWMRPLLTAADTVGPDSWPPASRLPPTTGGRRSAVLVLLGSGPEGPDVLLVERSPHLRSHAGQPAFPGGVIDPGDDGPVAAALREAREETGLDPAGVEVLLTLPPLLLTASNSVVTPVLSWWHSPSQVAPGADGEVAAVARVPLSELADPANRFRVRHPSGLPGPAFSVRGMLVWGFTALLLDRLLAFGGWERAWDTGSVRDLPEQALRLALRQRRAADAPYP